jgi:hypothetical protein
VRELVGENAGDLLAVVVELFEQALVDHDVPDAGGRVRFAAVVDEQARQPGQAEPVAGLGQDRQQPVGLAAREPAAAADAQPGRLGGRGPPHVEAADDQGDEDLADEHGDRPQRIAGVELAPRVRRGHPAELERAVDHAGQAADDAADLRGRGRQQVAGLDRQWEHVAQQDVDPPEHRRADQRPGDHPGQTADDRADPGHEQHHRHPEPGPDGPGPGAGHVAADRCPDPRTPAGAAGRAARHRDWKRVEHDDRDRGRGDGGRERCAAMRARRRGWVRQRPPTLVAEHPGTSPCRPAEVNCRDQRQYAVTCRSRNPPSGAPACDTEARRSTPSLRGHGTSHRGLLLVATTRSWPRQIKYEDFILNTVKPPAPTGGHQHVVYLARLLIKEGNTPCINKYTTPWRAFSTPGVTTRCPPSTSR